MKAMGTKAKKGVTLAQGCIIVMLAYCICAAALYWIGGDQLKFHNSPDNIESVQPTGPIGEMTQGFSVKQTFRSEIDTIQQLSIQFATYNRKNAGSVLVTLSDAESRGKLFEKRVDVSSLQDNSFAVFGIQNGITGTRGKRLELSVTAVDLDKANAVTLYYNNKEGVAGGRLLVNGAPASGALCFTVSGTEPVFFGQHYFPIMFAVGVLLAFYLFILCRKEKNGKKSLGLNAIHAFTRYRFLLDQLVSRDFKTKYKRSVLGVLWSFLNPLLSMTVQYIVFSTIFKSDIPNFAVYLLIGIVFFNFFTEAAGMGLSSIVSNSSLLTKVYIPKYIFPVSRVLSSAINFLLSLIPLFLVILATKTRMTPAILLLPFAVVCTVVFCIGMSMLLSSMMVFFRDTQFLWNVISMLWMYATPIFYPESILPGKLMFIFKMNPMYHVIRFARTIVLQGISPEPQAYLFCLLAAVIPFAIGAAVFKKCQNRFILYI